MSRFTWKIGRLTLINKLIKGNKLTGGKKQLLIRRFQMK